ncbi:MAG: hypothetical protein HQ582_09225 [Planctomycetes bacterium]|nr:hypothetical protein [Planctomycetota bacterium]
MAWETEAADARPANGQWLVAGVCSEYLQYCQRGLANGTISKGHHDNAVSWLNNLCDYCGALPVPQLKKGHVKTWIENHKTWRSSATHRSVIAIVLDEAAKTGADTLVTPCPTTLTLLQRANRTRKMVRDIVEVAADAVASLSANRPTATPPTSKRS